MIVSITADHEIARKGRRLWPTIRTRFGLGTPPPIPLVIDSTFSNAMVTYEPDFSAAPNAVIVLSKLLELPDNEVQAMITHELGHLALKHPIPGGRDNRRSYRADDREQMLGINAVNDTDAASVARRFAALAREVGVYDIPELSDVPDRGMAGSYLQQGAGSGLTTNPRCRDLWNAKGYLTQALRNATTFDGIVEPTPEVRAQLPQIVQNIRDIAPLCLTPSATVDFPTAAAPFALPPGVGTPAMIQQTYTSLGIDASVFAGKDALTGMYAVTKVLRERMAVMLAKDGVLQLRQYNAEEEADDFSMTILHGLGLDPESMGEAAPAEKPGAAECRAAVATGYVPRYDIAEAHHGTCYRKFHSKAFSAWLREGGAGVQPDVPRNIVRRAFDPTQDPIIIAD